MPPSNRRRVQQELLRSEVSRLVSLRWTEKRILERVKQVPLLGRMWMRTVQAEIEFQRATRRAGTRVRNLQPKSKVTANSLISRNVSPDTIRVTVVGQIRGIRDRRNRKDGSADRSISFTVDCPSDITRAALDACIKNHIVTFFMQYYGDRVPNRSQMARQITNINIVSVEGV